MYLRALQDSNSTNSTEIIFPTVEEEAVVDSSFEFSFVSTLVAAMFLILCIREYYVRRYGVDFCPVFHLFPSRQEQQVDGDRAYAEELQRQLDAENHEAELEARRKDRREWYEAYVVPYTMTVEENDFFYAQETDENGNTILEGKLTPTSRKYSSSSLDMEELMEEGQVTGEQSCNEGQPSDNEDEEVETLYLRLPIRDGEGHSRSVEANCTICFSDYQQGDRVVWSDLRCKHAFHYDCILPWLVKGKKRCPICRDWFVPGAKIEDQKKALAERLARESTAMSSTTDGLDKTDSQEDADNSLEVDPQGPSYGEALSLATDEVDATAAGSILHECQHNATTRLTGSKNQHSFEKQLSSSSSEADDDTRSCDCQCHEIPTNSDGLTCIESHVEAAVLTSGIGTTESVTLTESNSAPAPDLESQTDCESNYDNNTDIRSSDPTTTTSLYQHHDDEQLDASPLDDQSLSGHSESSKEISA